MTLVAVFAHPDDETFICGGTLAKYAEQGERVVLVCATKGEMGRRMGVPPTATRESLPQVRQQELRNACTALGIADLILLGFRDKTLEIQPLENLVDPILAQLRLEQPRVVLTFHEQHGGHADHCTIGRATTQAFSVYHSENPQARLIFVAWNDMASHPEAYGWLPEQMVRVDVRNQLERKWQAYRAHRTQSGINSWLWKDPRANMHKLADIEYFIQAFAPFGEKTGL